MIDGLYPLQELAKKAGVTRATISRYVQAGIIKPEKELGNFKLFDPKVLDDIKELKKRYKELSSLKGISDTLKKQNYWLTRQFSWYDKIILSL